MATRYIYLSGLGDRFDAVRRVMLAMWRLRGRNIVLVPMSWGEVSESYQRKQQRIREEIDSGSAEEVVLIGESAGGAMAIRMLADDPQAITRVVTICGYNHTATGIHDAHRSMHPAFVKTVEANDQSSAQIRQYAKRITTIFAPRDNVVAPKYSQIEGAAERRVPGRLHQLVIVLTVLARGRLWR